MLKSSGNERNRVVKASLLASDRSRRRGDAARDNREWTNAIAHYSKHLAYRSDDARVWVQLGHAHKELGRFAEARSAYETARRLIPSDADIHIQLGHLLKIIGNCGEALLSYREALEIDVNSIDTETLRLIGDIARDQDEKNLAAKCYELYLQRDSSDAAIWIQLGHIRKHEGRFPAARHAYETARSLSPESADVHIQYGNLMRILGEMDEALSAFKTAFQIESETGSTDLAHLVGDTLRDLQEWSAAAGYYELYLKRNPADELIWVQLGHALKETGQLAAARRCYETARERAPHHADAHWHLGHVLKMSGDIGLAARAYRDAMQIDPSLNQCKHEIGDFLDYPPELSHDLREVLAPFFDEEFYLRDNPKIRETGIDPLEHYHFFGWRQGRNPSRTFDVSYYLTLHDDVAKAEMDPLLHWVWAGRTEGRAVARPMDAERKQLAKTRDPRGKARDWGGAADLSEPVPPENLSACLVEATAVVLSIGHDDYVRHSGGVQNIIADEQRGANMRGWSYLHISPAAPLPVLAASDATEVRLSLRLNGKHIGVARAADVATIVRDLGVRGVQMVVSIHHLMGHEPHDILTIVEAAGSGSVFFWIHDFFTICSSYALMRNDVSYCGGPPAHSTACTICSYGVERRAHQSRLRAFFETARPFVLFPSKNTRDLWMEMQDLPHRGTAVQPPAQLFLALSYQIRGVAGFDARPLRVAHLGARLFHKGWHIFEKLALSLCCDGRYEFLQLGSPDGEPMAGCIKQIPVFVTPDRRNAMVDAVAENNVDIVVSWSVWPETFCFTVHEALAGGAFVVARRDAGNMWPAVLLNAPDQGCAVEDLTQLMALFAGSDLPHFLAKPRRRGALLPGEGIANRLAHQPDLRYATSTDHVIAAAQ